MLPCLSNATDDTRQVTPEDLDKRAKELGVMSIETSAKAGHNVKALFKKIAMALPGGSADGKDTAINQSESTKGSFVGYHCVLIPEAGKLIKQRSMCRPVAATNHRRPRDANAEDRDAGTRISFTTLVLYCCALPLPCRLHSKAIVHG